jgi:WD40 repeat protein
MRATPTGTANPDIHDDATVEPLQTVAFSPDGKYLAATTDRGGVGVWDADTREEIQGALSEVAGEAHALAFTPGGLVAVAASHGQVLFMDPNK